MGEEAADAESIRAALEGKVGQLDEIHPLHPFAIGEDQDSNDSDDGGDRNLPLRRPRPRLLLVDVPRLQRWPYLLGWGSQQTQNQVKKGPPGTPILRVVTVVLTRLR